MFRLRLRLFYVVVSPPPQYLIVYGGVASDIGVMSDMFVFDLIAQMWHIPVRCDFRFLFVCFC